MSKSGTSVIYVENIFQDLGNINKHRHGNISDKVIALNRSENVRMEAISVVHVIIVLLKKIF